MVSYIKSKKECLLSVWCTNGKLLVNFKTPKFVETVVIINISSN